MKPEPEILFRHCRLDTTNQLLWRGSRVIPLRQKSFAVLQYLVGHPGQLVTKDELLRAVWLETCVTDIVLKVCVRELRHALGDQRGAPQFIETVHRRGYRFIAPITTAQPVVRPASRVARPKAEVGSRSPTAYSLQPTASVLLPTPTLVGREREFAQLQNCLERARQGERQIVFVTGEPGIGKTTLVEAFLQSLESRVPRPASESQNVPRSTFPTPEPRRATHDGSPVQTRDAGVWIGRGQCIEHYGAGEAYLPVLTALHQLCRTPGHEQFTTLLSQQAPLWLMQLPAVLSPAERKRLGREVQGATRERMLRTLAEALEALTGVGARPAAPLLVLFVEDLQWSDHSTLELIGFLARRREAARVLFLGTYRLGEIGSNGHLKALKHELQTHGCCQELALGLLTEENVAEYLATRFASPSPVSGEACPEPSRRGRGEGSACTPLRQLARVVHQRTEGNPLFMVDVVEYLVAHGVIAQQNGHWELGTELAAFELSVPTSIQQVIETQIDRLSKDDQQVLEVASVAGMEFSAAAVAAGLEAEVEGVEERCEELARHVQFLRASGVSEWPDGTVAARYEFIHSLYQQVWYERIPAGRRARLHLRIGERGERAYGGHVGEVAAALAVHFERGHDIGRAVHYRQHAAESVLRRYGYQEAIGHLTRGLELLAPVPDSPDRVRQEILLQITLGAVRTATQGYAAPAVEEAYTRARELCQQINATLQLFPVLRGLWAFSLVRADLRSARDLAEQLLGVAHQEQNPALLLEADRALGQTLYFLGELPAARRSLEQSLARYDQQKQAGHVFLYGQDPGVVCLAQNATTLVLLGYPDQADHQLQAALTLAQAVAHPFSLALARYHAAVVYQARREPPLTLELAEATRALSIEHGFPYWLSSSTVLQGWALAEQGRSDEGIAQMLRGLADYQATGAELHRPYSLALLAETYGKVGRAAEALALVTEALTAVQKNGQHFYKAELYRLKGELLLRLASGV